MAGSRRIDVLGDRNEALARAAEILIAAADSAVGSRGRFSIALAGGQTPKGLYELLSGPLRGRLPWPSIDFFWGDERCVPPEDPQSNYGMAAASLLAPAGVSPSRTHRIEAEKPAQEAAALYEEELRRYFQPPDAAPPRFDLVLLGLGQDGHTASLFPGSAALAERSRWVFAHRVEILKAERITLTLSVLNNAAAVLFLALGQDKAQAARRALRDATIDTVPAGLVRPPEGDVFWVLDKKAASLL